MAPSEAFKTNDSVSIDLDDRGILSVSTSNRSADASSSPNDNDCIQFVSEHGAPVHIARALLSIINEVANIRDSEPGSIVS